MEVRAVDVTFSSWDCSLESAWESPPPPEYPGIRQPQPAVRLGLRTLDAAEVLQGLNAGDRVVLGDQVKAGARIRVRVVPWQPGKAATPGAAGPDAGSALTNAIGR